MLKLACTLSLIAAGAQAQAFTRAQQDVYHRIAGITTKGEIVLIAPVGRYTDVELSEDKKTVLWKVRSISREPDRADTTSHLIGWYRDGRRHSYLAGGYVRGMWFVAGGRRIGVKYGGEHVAGMNVLIDARTGKELARFLDADKTTKHVPVWVRQE